MMSEKRFIALGSTHIKDTLTGEEFYAPSEDELLDLLNTQQSTIIKLNDEKDYWKNKAMTLLMQVRRLTPRMTDKEVKEFNKELEE